MAPARKDQSRSGSKRRSAPDSGTAAGRQSEPAAERKGPSRIALVVAAAAAIAAVLIGVSFFSSRGDEAGDPATSPARTLLDGIPQDGTALGEPDAAVTLALYADFQCPFCAEWERETFPALVRRYVRPGGVRVEFRGLAFIGEDSEEALRAALAAGQQDRFWNIAVGLYHAQGGENSGWVTPELLRALAAGTPSLDADEMLADAGSAAVGAEMQRALRQAQRDGVTVTPTVFVGRTGGTLERVELTSLGPEGTFPAVQSALPSR
jgi:protein-disulfide isomerase